MYEIKYRKEDEMKDIGIEWLGMIPKDFKFKSLKYSYKFTTGSTPSSGDESYYSEDGYKWLTISDIKSKIIRDTSSYVSIKAVRTTNMKLNKKGSLVYSFKLSVGQVAFLGDDMYTNEAIATFDISNKNSLKFLYYMAPIFIIKNSNENIYGAKLLNQNLINNAKILIPKLREQEKIANFLDIKTAEFDSIISKKELLIEKLEEAKKSLISEVVTGKVKIVDGELVERRPDEMKDGGVQWLGMIPNDWEVTKAKYISDIFIPQRNKPELNIESGIPWVTIENLEGRYLSYKNNKSYVDKSAMKVSGSRILKKDSVIASCVGSFGMTSINAEDVIINQQLQAFTNIKIDIEYFSYYLEISGDYFDSVSTITTLKYVNKEKFENLTILVPNGKEQKKIVEMLNLKLERINSIINKTKLQIQNLKQAKQSLISECVTGKIDLRDWEIEEI